MAIVNTRFGTPGKDISTSPVQVGDTGTSGHLYTLFGHVANKLSQEVRVSLWVAANGWTSGTPSGATLVATILPSIVVPANGVVSDIPITLKDTEKIVAVSDTATSVDITFRGVDQS